MRTSLVKMAMEVFDKHNFSMLTLALQERLEWRVLIEKDWNSRTYFCNNIGVFERSDVSKVRIPLIRFRGGLQTTMNQGRPGGSQIGGSKTSSGSGQVYEDFALPRRFKRQLIDEREIDAINSGGAI